MVLRRNRFLLQKRNHTARAMSTSADPPSTPPRIAPIFLLVELGIEEGEVDGGDVGWEMLEAEASEAVTVRVEGAFGSTTSSSNRSISIWELLFGNLVSGWFCRIILWTPGVSK